MAEQAVRLTYAASLAVALLLVAGVSGCDYFVSPEARVERARAHLAGGDRRAALVELKNALQKRSELHEARLMLADVALWLGDPNSADSELQRVPRDVQPDAAEDLRARIDLALGRHDVLLKRLAQPGGALPDARRSLYKGRALLQQHSPREAERAFRDAIAQDDGLIPAHTGLVEALAAQGDASGAYDESNRLTRREPQSAEVWLTHGLLLARTNAVQALAALERARELAPRALDVQRHAMLLSALAELQLASRRIDAAKSTRDQLARLHPGSAVASIVASRVAMASNDYVTAAAELRRLVNALPQFSQARFMLGAALAAQGHLEQASQELGRVVEQAPELLEARQLLAQVRMRLNDPDGAMQVLAPGLQTEPESSHLAALMDAARVQAGADANTVDVLERAVAANADSASLRTQLAAAYLQSGAARKALELLRSSTAASPDPRREALLLQAILEVEGAAQARARLKVLLADARDPNMVRMSAAFLARLGDLDAARALLVSEAGKRRDAPGLYLTLAQLEWAARRPEAARAALQKALIEQPDYAPARLALAELELTTGRRNEARSQLEALRKRDPRATAARLLLARIALSENDAAQTEMLIAEALNATDSEAQTRASAGLIYLNAGRYDQAIEHLQAGIKIDAGAAPLWLHLGRAQLALNRHAAARESFERALALRPRWLAAEGALVFLDLQLKANDAAMQRVAVLRRAMPRDAAAAALEGRVLLTLQRYAEAAAAFDRAAGLQPSGALAASSYQARLAGKLPDATAPLERWVEQHPDDVAYRTVLAEALTRLNEGRKAVHHYERILTKQPTNVGALNNLAWLYYELGDPRAVELARRASAAAPDSAAVSDTLGWILVEAGEVAEGLSILERAAAHSSSEPEIDYHYGVALLRAGQQEKALAHLRRLLNEHPSFPSRQQAERLAAEGA